MNDPLTEAAAIALNGLRELRQQLLTTQEIAITHEKALDAERARTALLEQYLTDITRQRDFYQRFTVEIVTQLNNVGVLVNDVVQRAKDAAYKPSLASPEERPEVEAIPKFLQEQLDEGRRL